MDATCDQPIIPLSFAKSILPLLVAAAQKEYDDWDEANIDEYAGGGICHLIAEAMAAVLGEAQIEASTVSSSFEQHVSVVAQFAEGVYLIDIAPGTYERGAAYTWHKLPGVVFVGSDIIFDRLSHDPQQLSQYIED